MLHIIVVVSVSINISSATVYAGPPVVVMATRRLARSSTVMQ